jgi:tRNA pseudouridine(55) synthase
MIKVMIENKNNFWVNLYKPKGKTSNQMISFVRKKFGIKKVGHAGTLDPLAEGVLPIAVGEATKFIQYIQDRDKEYIFTVKFGIETATDDAEGEILKTETPPKFSEGEINKILPSFIGEITQIPPKYSAIKIDGKRAYDLARSGAEFEMKSRKTMIYSLKLLEASSVSSSCKTGSIQENSSHQSPVTSYQNDNSYRFHVSCGKGTYVRTLARDIAAKLGTIGHVTELIRTRVGGFMAEEFYNSSCQLSVVSCQDGYSSEGENSLTANCQPLNKSLDPVLQRDDTLAHRVIPTKVGIQKNNPVTSHQSPVASYNNQNQFLQSDENLYIRQILPVHAMLDDIPVMHVSEIWLSRLKNGQRIRLEQEMPDSIQLIFCNGEFAGLAGIKGNILFPEKIINR